MKGISGTKRTNEGDFQTQRELMKGISGTKRTNEGDFRHKEN